MKEQKTKRGGHRPNAGRKSIYGEPMKQIAFSLDQSMLDRIEKVADDAGISRSDALRWIIGTGLHSLYH